MKDFSPVLYYPTLLFFVLKIPRVVGDLTGALIPGYWVNKTSWSLPAKDNRYNIREWCYFKSLDEERKILYYTDVNGEEKEFRYGDIM